MSDGGFSFGLVGLSPLVVLPVLALAVWGIARLARPELESQPPQVQRGLAWLRRGAVALILLMLLEPTLTRLARERELPTVAVLVDRSGSMALTDRQMAATDRLDEAVGLGLIDRALRPDGAHRAAVAADGLLADAPQLTKALSELAEALRAGAGVPDAAVALATARRHVEAVAATERDIAGIQGFSEHLAAQRTALEAVIATLSAGAKTGELPAERQPSTVAQAFAAHVDATKGFAERARAAQQAADNALVAGAEAGSPVAAGLAQSGELSRFERARRLALTRLTPLLAQARLEWYALDGDAQDGLSAFDPASPPSGEPRGTTDFATPLGGLSRAWSTRHVGGVILLSDGRQTAGADAAPVARALAARGGQIAAIRVGDPGQPRDAVIAEISGPAEVFRGETVHLDVRYRIAGYPERDFDLVLARDGAELERRTVRGADSAWRLERFAVDGAALERAGGDIHAFQARIEPNRGKGWSSSVHPGGGLLRELWTGVGTKTLEQFSTESAGRAPDASEPVAQAAYSDPRENFVGRLRGYVVAPATGEYTFWVAGDDECELWLAKSPYPHERVRIAAVPGWTQVNEWDKYAAQRSAPVALEAGGVYYLEVLHRQEGGAAHVAIGWQLPDNAIERPIPGARLAPWTEGFAPNAADANAEDAEASLANNQAELAVAVTEDPLRVLVIDAVPRWETRYVVAMFERDPRVEVVRRYRQVRLPRGEFELLPADQRDLDAFDIVVLGDLTPSELPIEDQDRLKQFVGRRGGFLACIAGPRGMPHGYSLGSLADLLPIRATGASRAERATVAIELANPDTAHPITDVLDDADLNRKLWPELPRLEWYAAGVVAKPGTEPLLVTKDASRSAVVAATRFGGGRVLWVGTDELWRWRDPLGDRVHQAFWLQAVRWGLGTRLRGKDRHLQAALDRSLLAPGEVADVRARVQDDAGSPGTAKPLAQIERIDDQGQGVPGSAARLDFVQVADGDAWTLRLAGLAEGRWRVTITSSDPAHASLSEVRELVVRRRQGAEGIELGADQASLQRLAGVAGGKAVGFADAEATIAAFAKTLNPRVSERRTTISLWQNHLALLVVLGLLGSEWLWRKRRGLP